MGFKTGSYATVWEITPRSNLVTGARISISRKDTKTNQYVQEFSGFVSFVGTSAASKAAKLKPKDRIKLCDIDVAQRYDAEHKKTYTNYSIYSFESVDNAQPAQQQRSPEPDEFDAGDMSGELPF